MAMRNEAGTKCSNDEPGTDLELDIAGLTRGSGELSKLSLARERAPRGVDVRLLPRPEDEWIGWGGGSGSRSENDEDDEGDDPGVKFAAAGGVGWGAIHPPLLTRLRLQTPDSCPISVFARTPVFALYT